VIVWCDAAFRPRLPGRPAWAGFAAGRVRKARRVPAEDSVEAELRAVRLALAHVVKAKARRAVVATDCLIAYGYLTGGRCRKPRHLEVLARIRALLPMVPGVRFRWVPREKNREAHAVCAGTAKMAR